MRAKPFAILATLAALAWAVPAGAGAEPTLRGFVSGHLLLAWCSGESTADRQDCISYLRGVSDTFNAIGWEAGLEPATDADPAAWPNRCTDDRVSIGELKEEFLKLAKRDPGALGNQAVVIIMRMFREAFPCVPVESRGSSAPDGGKAGAGLAAG